MYKPRISAIAAIGKNRELGSNNDLLWKFEADFIRMKALISGHPLIMGRKTYESIGAELPRSTSLVITRDPEYQSPYPDPQRTEVFTSLDTALQRAKELEIDDPDPEVFIFGGAEIYKQALPQTDRLYLTRINATHSDADAFFPTFDEFKTILETKAHTENGIDLTLQTLER